MCRAQARKAAGSEAAEVWGRWHKPKKTHKQKCNKQKCAKQKTAADTIIYLIENYKNTRINICWEILPATLMHPFITIFCSVIKSYTHGSENGLCVCSYWHRVTQWETGVSVWEESWMNSSFSDQERVQSAHSALPPWAMNQHRGWFLSKL